MRSKVFVNGTAILADTLLEDAEVRIEGRRIVAVSKATRRRWNSDTEVIDCRGGYISPGFVDIHIHGGGGADFMDGTVEAARQVCRAHARHGTTTLFPTTTTGSQDQILAMIAACQELKKMSGTDHGAQIAGIHLYGPYFAEDKVGCHPASGRRSPLSREYQRYFATGMIKVATCAAELPGAEAFYRAAHNARCLITCGHSNASWSEMARAYDAGMRHVDHFWCAMSSVSSVRARLGVPMQGSMLEFVLGMLGMSTEVIADGSHLAPELLEFAYRMKSAKRLCLVTDCNRALDMPPGRYRFGNKQDGSWFDSDGEVGWATNGSLASSVQGMVHMVRHMRRHTSASLPDIVRMASLTPAERAGISRQTGSLQTGKRADVLVLGRSLAVQRVFIAGAEFSRARPRRSR